jgi:hypothetical protein
MYDIRIWEEIRDRVERKKNLLPETIKRETASDRSLQPSGVTAKPANGGHFKTGQRKWPGTRLFYSDAS